MYFTEFCNPLLTFPDINDGEMQDRFVAALAKDVRVKGLKSSAVSYAGTAKAVLQIDKVLAAAKAMIASRAEYLMEFGNIKKRNSKSIKWRKMTALRIVVSNTTRLKVVYRNTRKWMPAEPEAIIEKQESREKSLLESKILLRWIKRALTVNIHPQRRETILSLKTK